MGNVNEYLQEFKARQLKERKAKDLKMWYVISALKMFLSDFSI